MLSAAVALSPTVLAAGTPQEGQRQEARERREEREERIDREAHRRAVEAYFRQQGVSRDWARARAREYREGERLRNGWEQRMTPIPDGLTGRLPVMAPHYQRYFVGRDMVIVDTRTNRVAAVIPSVVPR
jgi:hypothetical protein